MRISGIATVCALAILVSVSELVAGAWTLPKGRLRMKTGVFYQSTQSRFCTGQDAASPAFRQIGCTAAGHSAPFDPFIGGDVEAFALLTELMFGVTAWLDVGMLVPYYSIRFTNLSDPDRPRTSSLGDIGLFGKIRFVEKPFVVSLEVGVKSPTGKFTVDSEIVNVSEKQWDVDFLGEIGKSLWPLPVYVGLGVGYRFRSDNTDFEHTFANEWIAYFEAGYNVNKRLLLKGYMHWLRGNRPTVRQTGGELLWRRELMTLTPSFLYSPFSGVEIEGGIRFSLSGEDYPAGPQFIGTLAYHLQLIK